MPITRAAQEEPWGLHEMHVADPDGVTLIFVEVKARTRLSLSFEAITPAQMRRVGAAARAWLARHPEHMAFVVRFDAIFLAPRHWPRHIVQAFEVDF